jgi:hypothetical protein
MSASPQQRRQAPISTVSRELTGTSSSASHFATARAALQAFNATPETGAGKVVAPAPSPLANTAAQTTRLPRPVSPKHKLDPGYTPPWATREPPVSSPSRRSFKDGPPAGDREQHQALTTAPFLANSASRPRWGGKSKSIPRMPQDTDIGQGRDPYPSYAAANESSTHRSRQPPRPSWGGSAGRPSTAWPSSNSHRGADAATGSGPSRPSISTPPRLHPSYVDTDAVIARLMKPHPKLVAQAATKKAQKDEPAPRQRSADKDCPIPRPVDVYRPAPQQRADAYRPALRQHVDVYRPATNVRSGPEPERVNDHARYSAWSRAKLLREADIRRLVCEYKDPEYLAEILFVNDRKFFEKLDEYQHLSIKQLLEEAEIEHVCLAHNNYWEYHQLLLELAEKLAEVTVTRHNGLHRAEEVARRQTTQPRVSVYADRPPRSHQVLRITKDGQKLKDLALKNKAESEPVTSNPPKFPSKTVTAPADKGKIVRTRRDQEEARKKSTETQSSIKRKSKTSKDEGSQHDDSGYFTGDGKPSTSQSTSTASSIGDENDDEELPINRAKERTNTQRNSKQDSPKPVTDKLLNKPANTKKRARAIEDQDESTETPSKKMKTSPAEDVVAPVAKTSRIRQPCISSSDHHEQVEANVGFSKTTLQSKLAKNVKEIAPKEYDAHEALVTINRESKVKKASPSQEDDAVSPPKPTQKRKARAIDAEDDEREDPDGAPLKPAKQGTKRKAERELMPDFDASSPDDSGSASSSEENRPKNKITGSRGTKAQKMNKEPKKLRGISTSERIPGMAYKKYADGSWNLAKKAAAARKGTKTAEPRYNYIK